MNTVQKHTFFYTKQDVREGVFYMANFEIKDAKTCGVELAEAPLMVSNNLNRLISNFQQNKGLMVDVTGNIEKGIYGFEDINITFSDREARDKIAQAMQSDIIETGGSLEQNFWRNNKRLLATLYLLTGLSYVSVEAKDGRCRTSYLATKNPVCLNYMLRFCSMNRISDRRMDSIESKRIITKQELENGAFEVIKFEDKYKSGGKFHLTSCKLHPNSKKTTVLPYTLACKRTESIMKRLKSGVCEIDCRINGVRKIIKGTLKYGSDYDKAMEYNVLDACVFPVRDVESKEVILLNTLDIFTIKECKGGK